MSTARPPPPHRLAQRRHGGISAAILIGAEVFGAAFAGSWALATLFDLGGIGARVLDVVFDALRRRHHGAVRPLRRTASSRSPRAS